MLRLALRVVLVLLAFVSVQFASAADAASNATPPKGSLVIIGGNLRPGNAPVWERILQLAGGKDARIAVFASASGYPEKSGKFLVDRLNSYGAKAFFVPVAVKLAGSDYHAAADDPKLAELVRSAGGAFFAGGDQIRITSALRHEDGSNTRVLDALWDMYRRGGVIAGTSAGAAIMSSTMFGRPRAVLATLKLGIEDGKEITDGLGFVGDDVFIDQHFLIRGRFARMLPVMLAKGYTLGLGIDENTAAVVGPSRDVTIVGYRGALVLDLAGATVDKAKPDFNLSNARISYLDSGDRFNLVNRAYSPGPDKEPLKNIDREHREAIFTTDILGNTSVVNLLEKLVDSDQQRALGIAFDGPASKSPERGFEFTFTRVPDTREYATNREDAYSIYRTRMDIRPVKMHQPLYSAD